MNRHFTEMFRKRQFFKSIMQFFNYRKISTSNLNANAIRNMFAYFIEIHKKMHVCTRFFTTSSKIHDVVVSKNTLDYFIETKNEIKFFLKHRRLM